jgi:hypothetical protein
MENNNLDIDRERQEFEYHNFNGNSFDLSKSNQELIPTVQNSIEMLLKGVQNGYINALDVFATFKKLEGIFNDAKKQVDELAILEAEKYDKTFTYQNVQFTKRDGAERLNFNEDDVCQKLELSLKERKELVKLATKSKDAIYDADGVEVPKVSSKFDKSSLTIKFK